MNVLSPGQYPDLHFIKFIAGKLKTNRTFLTISIN